MTVRELIDKTSFKVVNRGDDSRPVEGVFCCDLLSIAMGKAPAGSAWVTVMSNVNTLAVATLADVSLVVLAGGVKPDETVIAKAAEQEVTMLLSEEPVFETALKIHQLL